MLTDEERKKIIWYWDPVEETVMIDTQYMALSEDVKARCKEITNYAWRQLIENPQPGKHIGNDPATNLPAYVDDPAPTQEELLKQEMQELKAYLSATDYQAIKCGELGLSMATEYPESHAHRTAARNRINEIETLLGITPQTVTYPS